MRSENHRAPSGHSGRIRTPSLEASTVTSSQSRPQPAQVTGPNSATEHHRVWERWQQAGSAFDELGHSGAGRDQRAHRGVSFDLLTGVRDVTHEAHPATNPDPEVKPGCPRNPRPRGHRAKRERRAHHVGLGGVGEIMRGRNVAGLGC
jgi:hypothetical protein